MANQPIELIMLGSEVARAFRDNSQARDQAIDQARLLFENGSSRPRSRDTSSDGHRRRVWMLAIAPTLAIAAAMLLFFWSGTSTPLTFRVDGKGGTVDSWLAAPEQHSVFVEFSDGTGVRIDPTSRARVMDVASMGARVSLESGAIHAEVVHTSRSAWSFIAGPINVRVIGTKFDMHWDPTNERFSVAVLEGTVGVSGALAGAERPVRAGETLYVSLRERKLELVTTPLPSNPTLDGSVALTESAAADPAPIVQEGDAAIASADSASALVESTAQKAPPRWRELANRGQLREAFAAVETSGFAEACQSANPAELLLLGDAARLAGRPERATLALMTLRQRYPADGRRAAAAFALGKVAFDQRRAYDVAANWFSTCLQEQPAGGFAREASGRLIEAYRSAGNRSAAQTAARSYLTRYPSGPHAELARSLLP